jgi:hypothetical protein
MVISGGNFKPDTLKPKEVVSLLLDDEEIEAKCKRPLSLHVARKNVLKGKYRATRHSVVSLRVALHRLFFAEAKPKPTCGAHPSSPPPHLLACPCSPPLRAPSDPPSASARRPFLFTLLFSLVCRYAQGGRSGDRGRGGGVAPTSVFSYWLSARV